jgi:hypothetical protein
VGERGTRRCREGQLKPGLILFRYPLCLHSFGLNPQERMHYVTAWCAFEVGREMYGSMDNEQTNDKIAQIPEEKLPSGFNRAYTDHERLVLGMSSLRMQGGSANHMAKQAAEVQQFINERAAKYGKDSWTSLKSELVWEIINNSGISWREFSVLAAIYSFVGKRESAYITRSVIQQRALGYKTAAMMKAEMKHRQDGIKKPMTNAQTNYTLDRLHERRFFARVRRDHWHTYYSTRLTQEELEAKLLNGATYKLKFHQGRVAKDQAFISKVKEARANVKTDANVNSANVNTPNTLHIVGTEDSLRVHDVFTLEPSTLEPFTSLNPNPNPNTEPHIKEPVHSAAPAPDSSDSASEEMSKVIGSDGKQLTTAEAKAFWEKFKREAGL